MGGTRVTHQIGLMLRSRWHRFGDACVNFGTPVSIRAYATERNLDFRCMPKEQRTHAVAQLGRHLMDLELLLRYYANPIEHLLPRARVAEMSTPG